MIQLAAAMSMALLSVVGTVPAVSALAELARADPPVNGTVSVTPAVVEIVFDGAVRAEGTTIQVIGPGGIQVDLSDAAVDLEDPNRQRVTVSLRAGLGPGTYRVQWVAVATTDGEEARGSYSFRVGAGSPVASPIVTPEPDPSETATTEGTPDAPPAESNEPAGGYDFDSRSFGISVGVGVAAALLIYLFWRLVRPKHPTFRG